ncbi:MAG TPA: RNA polymerase sigma factor [Gemmatimonadales bacterium]
MIPTDDQLIAQIAAGEPTALDQLMNRHGPRLMRFATHYLHSSSDADDVLQEVFLRADRAIRNGSRPDQVSAWLFRITVNRCRSHRRRWWPFVSGAAADHAIARAATTDTHEQFAWRDEIDRALSTLSAPLREAFLLKHVDGMAYDEMVAVTGASLSALKMRVTRACDQLRERLQEVRNA